MVIAVVIVVYIFGFSRDIARWTITRNMTRLEKEYIEFLYSDEAHENYETIYRNGILVNTSDEYKELALTSIQENCGADVQDLYQSIMFGGFDTKAYLEDYSLDEFVDMIAEFDVYLPDEIEPVKNNGEIQYDLKGNEIHKRVSFWRLYCEL